VARDAVDTGELEMPEAEQTALAEAALARVESAQPVAGTRHRMDNVTLGKYGAGMFAGEACQ
jgi:hypothetical protein